MAVESPRQDRCHRNAILRSGGSNVPALHVDVPGTFDEAKYWAEFCYSFAELRGLHADFQWLRTPETDRIFEVRDGVFHPQGRLA